MICTGCRRDLHPVCFYAKHTRCKACEQTALKAKKAQNPAYGAGMKALSKALSACLSRRGDTTGTWKEQQAQLRQRQIDKAEAETKKKK